MRKIIKLPVSYQASNEEQKFKPEARSTKSETISKYEFSKFKTKAAWYDALEFFLFCSFVFCSFGFVSNFDIRVSNLLFFIVRTGGWIQLCCLKERKGGKMEHGQASSFLVPACPGCVGVFFSAF
jgi:hypothetical protein